MNPNMGLLDRKKNIIFHLTWPFKLPTFLYVKHLYVGELFSLCFSNMCNVLNEVLDEGLEQVNIYSTIEVQQHTTCLHKNVQQ